MLELDAKEIRQKLRNLECPFCSYRANTFSVLVMHIRAKHQIDSCPVCGYSGTYLTKHLGRCSDELHELFYAMYCTRGNHGRHGKLRDLRKELFEE